MGRDMISNLPDEILGKILSLLPTKVAASTLVLSKRWRRNLLVLVDTLCFDDTMVLYPNEEEEALGSHCFFEFVEKTLALVTNSRIKKFSLCLCRQRQLYGSSDEYYRCVNRWISTAMEDPLLELHLDSPTHFSFVTIETKLFTSNTLVKLTLSGEYDLEAESVFFPSLKSLYLLSVLFDHCNYARLIYGCPVLEDLYIRDGDFSHLTAGCGTEVRSASIKRLVIVTNLPDDIDAHHRIVFFETPSLVYLDYSSYVSTQYEVPGLDSLVEARLNLRLWMSTKRYDYDSEYDFVYDYDFDYANAYANAHAHAHAHADAHADADADSDADSDADAHADADADADVDADADDDDDDHDYDYEVHRTIFGDVTELVAGICNISTLHLSPDSLEAFHFCCEYMPVFNNLINLSIESNKKKGWQVMPLLLKSCPNLHALAIKGLVHRVSKKCGDACPCIPKYPLQKKEENDCEEGRMLFIDMSSEGVRDFRVWRFCSRAETNETFRGQVGMS